MIAWVLLSEDGEFLRNAAVNEIGIFIAKEPNVIQRLELKASQTVSEAELMEFAKDHISERAAVPKKIYFVDQLPLTSVGKVFKPKLLKEQMVEVCSEIALQVEEIECVEVSIEKNKHTGKKANIIIKVSDKADFKKTKEKVVQGLGMFTFNFEVL